MTTIEPTGRTEMRTVRIPNLLGLHARPAAEVVKLASRFAAEIFLAKADLEVNGKSIMGVMMLAAECGSELRISASGEDGREAVTAIAELVETGFGEELAT
jgi:phosphocarrier protein